MAYKVIILYRLYMPSYFLGTFTEYPEVVAQKKRYPKSIYISDTSHPYHKSILHALSVTSSVKK